MKTLAKTIIIAMLLAFGLAGISCNRDKSANQGAANVSPEQSKAREALQKIMESSKKTTVAKVNGVSISMYDLIREMNAIAPEYVKPGQQKDPKVAEKVRKEALDRLIYRELAVQDAVRQGMQAPQQKIGDEIKRAKTEMKTDAAYREFLSRSGMTEEELKKQIERNILVDMITEKEIFDKVQIDPEQVKKVYDRKKASYKGPAGNQLSFEEARPAIEEKLMTPLVHKREDEWVDGLKKRAKIEITPGGPAKDIHSVN